MIAIEVTAFGGPEVLQSTTLPDPAPAAGKALILLEASGVLSIDALLRADGGVGLPFEVTLPWIPGQGGAGIVVGLGDGVSEKWMGRRVLVDTQGSYAELMVAAPDVLVPIPDAVSSNDAAALMHDGGTARGLFAEAGPSGGTVAIRPAAGGAGGVLVQLAKRAGASVIGVVGSAGKADHVRSLGADEVIVGDGDWAEGERLFDVVFDGVGGSRAPRWLAAVKAGGTYLNYGNAGGGFAAPQDPTAADAADISVIDGSVLQRLSVGEGRRKRQYRILELAAAGDVVAPVGATYPLGEAERAHRDLAARSIIGKAILLPGN